MSDSVFLIKQTFDFVLKTIKTISIRRENKLLIDRCESMRESLKNLSYKSDLIEFRNELYNVIDQLRFIIQAELRFFLFPLPEIKQETVEIGKNYMDNFLQWYDVDNNLTVEEILKFLDEEAYLLSESKVLLEKLIIVDLKNID